MNMERIQPTSYKCVFEFIGSNKIRYVPNHIICYDEYMSLPVQERANFILHQKGVEISNNTLTAQQAIEISDKNNKFITADFARELADNNQPDIVQLGVMLETIQMDASKGRYSIEFCLTKNQFNILSQLGYNLEKLTIVCKGGNGNVYIVSWK